MYLHSFFCSVKESVSCCKDAEKKSAISSCFVSNADAWLNNNNNEWIIIVIAFKIIILYFQFLYCYKYSLVTLKAALNLGPQKSSTSEYSAPNRQIKKILLLNNNILMLTITIHWFQFRQYFTKIRPFLSM